MFLFIGGIGFQAIAQKLPKTTILLDGKVPYGFYKAGIRYGDARGDSLHIRWSHTAQADTFWVYKGMSRLEYITNANTRTVFYRHPDNFERRMATHHLREFIFDSPLRFNDLEGLAKKRNPQFMRRSLREYFTY
ncbi:MAG: hypothetical protein LBC85_02340 [Fibromonadaceae bacterium]|nr:hypothetical protein [Fibromonadaceae bacterium]